MNKPLLEICVENLVSALAAQEGGADRIELCEQLSVGGITPRYELIRQVKKEVDIPVHVLIRPRAGHFCYTQDELNHMRRDIQFCESAGIEGIVVGVLLPDGRIDESSMFTLLDECGSMKTTFHRAFDEVNDPFEAFQQISLLNIDRILTSGLARTAILGADLIRELIQMSVDQVIILPGAGLQIDNITNFANRVQAKEYHGSFSTRVGNSFLTEAGTVREVVKQLESIS